jgi:hypothetical protein
MEHFMKHLARFTFVFALLSVLVFTATPASADHKSNPISVTCDAGTNTVTVTIQVFDGGVGNDPDQFIYINGNYVGFIDFADGIPDGTYTGSATFPDAIVGAVVVATDYGDSVSTSCGFGGPGIPAGFELHTISCDVAVFVEPGGSPVASGEAIRAGQTWYVNPKPVTGADGQSWTEIFVSSRINPFIPTKCVQ